MPTAEVITIIIDMVASAADEYAIAVSSASPIWLDVMNMAVVSANVPAPSAAVLREPS